MAARIGVLVRWRFTAHFSTQQLSMHARTQTLRRYVPLLLSWTCSVALSAWGYVTWMLPVPDGTEAYANTVSYQLTMFTIFVFPLWLLLLFAFVAMRRMRER